MSDLPVTPQPGVETPGHPGDADLDAQLIRYAQDLHDLMQEHRALNLRHQSMLESLGRPGPDNDLFLAVLKHPGVASMVTDVRGVVREVSAATCTLMGWNCDAVKGRALIEFLVPASGLWDHPVPATDLREALTHRVLYLPSPASGHGAYDAWVKQVVEGKTIICHWLLHARQPEPLPMGQSLAQAMRAVEGVFDWQVASGDGIQVVAPFSAPVVSGFAQGDLFGLASRQFGISAGEEAMRQAFWACMNAFGCWTGSTMTRRKNDGMGLQRRTVHAVCDAFGRVEAYLSVCLGQVEHQGEMDRLNWLAHHDTLTQLPNRRMLDECLHMELLQAQSQGQMLALIYMDLDRFKPINDQLGHQVGDRVLQQVAIRLQSSVREDDVVARVGGDEFIILLKRIQHKPDIQRVAEAVIASVSEPLLVGEHRLTVGCSLGCARYPTDGTDGESLIRHADAAMYAAKEQGGSLMHFHNAQGDDEVPAGLGLALWGALDRGEIWVMYQPQVDARQSHRIMGCEALVRWTLASGVEVGPDVFIPIAERNGFIRLLGEWVFKTAVRQLADWRALGWTGLRMSVNVSPKQLEDAELPKRLRQLACEADVPSTCVELEVTESVAMSNQQVSFDMLAQLRSYGFKVAIDDFGMGYSSLARLKHMPIDRLKIDRQFVHDLSSSSVALAVSQCFVDVGLALGIDVIAEGVESADQLQLLADQGCQQVQGFLTGRPMTAQELTAAFRATLPTGETGEVHGTA